jgi:hypothetical protein
MLEMSVSSSTINKRALPISASPEIGVTMF